MDSRFHLKVTFSIYGQEFKQDASLNWFAPPGEIDRRITDWFLDCYEKAKFKNDAELREMNRHRESEEAKAQEIAELKRLKQKYPTL